MLPMLPLRNRHPEKNTVKATVKEAIFTMGEDEGGYFTHINSEFGKWTIEPMKNMGVTH